jgi:hypothetical protein
MSSTVALKINPKYVYYVLSVVIFFALVIYFGKNNLMFLLLNSETRL